MTADAQFKKFVERQQEFAAVDKDVDWKNERDEWLSYLHQLYDQIAGYLAEYIAAGTIKLHSSTIELNEENIGSYTAERLAIVIGAQEIILNPIGTLLIGSKGRVDVEGSAGSSRLVLINKNISSPTQMFRITVSTRSSGSNRTSKPEASPTPERIEWAWKIASRPPAMQFIELNKETLFQMLMEVSNG